MKRPLTLFRMRTARAAHALIAVGSVVVAAAMGACSDDDLESHASSDAGSDVVTNESGRDSSTSGDSAADSAADTDADAAIRRCDPLGTFGTPTRSDLSSPVTTDWSAVLSEGGLVATFASLRDADASSSVYSVFTSTRPAIDQPWTTPVHEAVFDGMSNAALTVSADGLTMFLERQTLPPTIEASLWIARRTSTALPWSVPSKWSESVAGDRLPSLVHDGSAVYFIRDAAIHRAPRTTTNDYGAPVEVTWAGTPPNDPWWPVVTSDELTLYLAARPPASGPFDVIVSRRAMPGDPWGTPSKIAELSSTGPDWPSWTSPDGCEVYFSSFGGFADSGESPTSVDIWVASRGGQ